MDHGVGNYIEANVFQEMTIGAGDVGTIWDFSFDYLKNGAVVNGDGDAMTFAFVKVLKASDGSFALLQFDQFDTTGTWASQLMSITIDPSYAGELLQIGFASLATDFDDTGRYYDNLVWDLVDSPGIGDITCLGNPNSTGVGADLTITGSKLAADNDVTLSVTNLPMNAVGFFVTSPGALTVYNPAGSEGHLCIAGAPIGRYAGNILNSGTMGAVALTVDLTNTPSPTGSVVVGAGDTQYYQYWTRDALMGTAVSNFSDAKAVTFE